MVRGRLLHDQEMQLVEDYGTVTHGAASLEGRCDLRFVTTAGHKQQSHHSLLRAQILQVVICNSY